MEPILSVSHLQKVYGDRGSHTRALDDLSFDVLPGEFVGVMGASGSGKTTLLNCVSTIDRPSSGTITVDGTDVTALRGKALSRFRRERLGFVFQDCNLLDTLTAFENIALSLSILRTPAAQIRDRVEETAELLGIGDCLDKYPYQMSGGQQQRCAAARAIVTRPALVLADEPTGALDSKSSRLLLERLEVGLLVLPDVEEEDPLRREITALAEEKGIETLFLAEDADVTFGESALRIYAPLGSGGANEEGLSVLCTAGDFDGLITGDMNDTVEKRLIKYGSLPDLELLVAGHHGSKYATSEELLLATTPELAVISVGYNTYGHPAPETLERLAAAGCAIYRTDWSGTVTITAK